jgi:hypothetical protein
MTCALLSHEFFLHTNTILNFLTCGNFETVEDVFKSVVWEHASIESQQVDSVSSSSLYIGTKQPLSHSS